jgi:hypothetical protein
LIASLKATTTSTAVRSMPSDASRAADGGDDDYSSVVGWDEAADRYTDQTVKLVITRNGA